MSVAPSLIMRTSSFVHYARVLICAHRVRSSVRVRLAQRSQRCGVVDGEPCIPLLGPALNFRPFALTTRRSGGVAAAATGSAGSGGCHLFRDTCQLVSLEPPFDVGEGLGWLQRPL
jgi:hypothetical protein